MRGFIVISLVALAQFGSTFEPFAHSDIGVPFVLGAEAIASSYYLPANDFLASSNSAASAYDAPTYAASAELEKEFYSFSALDNEFEDAAAAQRALGSVKQGLRVVFIKGPENKGFEDAALALAKQAAQQQTAIYVLNKQQDIGDLVNKFNAAGKNAHNKPQVHFVKYRTAIDAANAQRAIQSQYAALGGNTQSINGGAAPVLNFASQSIVQGFHPQQPTNAYLPSSVFN